MNITGKVDLRDENVAYIGPMYRNTESPISCWLIPETVVYHAVSANTYRIRLI